MVPSSGSTIQRWRASVPSARAAFLDQQAVAGPRPLQLGLQRALGLEIGGRDEIARPLDRDLELLDLAEIADQAARRLERGARP